MLGRIIVLPTHRILIPGTITYVTSRGKKDIADVNKLRMLRWGNVVDNPGQEVCLMQSVPKKQTGSSDGQSQKWKVRVRDRFEAAMLQVLNMKYEAKESRHLYELEKTKKNTLES